MCGSISVAHLEDFSTLLLRLFWCKFRSMGPAAESPCMLNKMEYFSRDQTVTQSKDQYHAGP